jgi:penicillin-binding protein 1A
LNVATVDLATYLNLSKIIKTAKKMGVSTKLRKDPSIILGTSEVKLIDMVVAYTTVNNGGYMTFPYAIKEITDTNDASLYLHNLANEEKVLSDEAVSKMNELLREVVVKGTGRKAISVSGAKGKTGTSQNYRDAWFIGSTDEYTTAVWVGNDDNSPMIRVGGSSVPVEIWTEIMKDY